MVGAGMAMLALAVCVFASLIRRHRLPTSRLFLLSTIAAGALSVLAIEAGWVVTEVGRQPWIVQGFMRTKDAVTKAPGLGVLFAITLGVYLVLFVGCWLVLRILARQPLPESSNGA
jgi:cytochrome d ubiquinol oxidase subunit I